MWDVRTGELARALEGPDGGLDWVAWHPRGHVLLAGGEDATAWMWNADDGSCMQVSIFVLHDNTAYTLTQRPAH